MAIARPTHVRLRDNQLPPQRIAPGTCDEYLGAEGHWWIVCKSTDGKFTFTPIHHVDPWHMERGMGLRANPEPVSAIAQAFGRSRRVFDRLATPGAGGFCTQHCYPGCCFNESGGQICCVTGGDRHLCVADCFAYEWPGQHSRRRRRSLAGA